ncbi:NYN domain-containing protein [Patescibacteria group bacterium]|nr:NYN domain-containing protein [Patescibacteria group bacterium]
MVREKRRRVPTKRRRVPVRVVVFVDHHNLVHQAKDLDVSLDAAYSWILDTAKELGEVISVFMLLPTYQEASDIWAEVNSLQIKYGTVGLTFPVLRRGDFYKDVVDPESFLWVAEFSDSFDSAVFVTGDGDFIAVASMLKRKGKEVRIYTANFGTTSDELFMVALTQEIQIDKASILVSPTNRFCPILQKVLQAETLNPQERRILNLLAKAEKALPSLVVEEMTVRWLEQALKKHLDVKTKECSDLIEILLALDIIQCHPQTTTAIYFSQPSSSLQSLEAAL